MPWRKFWRRESRPAALPVLPPAQKYHTVMGYATAAVDLVDDRYPVTIQAVMGRNGVPVRGSSLLTANTRQEFEELARRLDNICPGGVWGIRFAQ